MSETRSHPRICSNQNSIHFTCLYNYTKENTGLPFKRRN